MPKMRGDGKKLKKGVTVRRKFRIGTRKSGRSAHEMTNDELRDYATRESKYAAKAIQVLALRGVTI